jgi:hypothetical protein
MCQWCTDNYVNLIYLYYTVHFKLLIEKEREKKGAPSLCAPTCCLPLLLAHERHVHLREGRDTMTTRPRVRQATKSI